MLQRSIFDSIIIYKNCYDIQYNIIWNSWYSTIWKMLVLVARKCFGIKIIVSMEYLSSALSKTNIGSYLIVRLRTLIKSVQINVWFMLMIMNDSSAFNTIAYEPLSLIYYVKIRLIASIRIMIQWFPTSFFCKFFENIFK